MGKFDTHSSPPGAAREGRGPSQIQDNPELVYIARWLSTVKFRPKAFGGVDPEDVWRKLEELNSLYENALVAERARCNLLIRQLRLEQQLSEGPNGEE